MPAKKKNKKHKKVATKIKKAVRKKKKVVVKKKAKKNKLEKVEDLAKQLPEDKYTLALQQKEELERERIIKKPAYAKASVGKKNKKTQKYTASRSFMWFLVIGVFLLILFGWLYSLQFTLKNNGATTDHSWSSFTENFSNSFTDFKQSMLNFKNNVQKIENANINTNYNNKKNVNSISEEQLKQMEDKVFPKLKNNLNK